MRQIPTVHDNTDGEDEQVNQHVLVQVKFN